MGLCGVGCRKAALTGSKLLSYALLNLCLDEETSRLSNTAYHWYLSISQVQTYSSNLIPRNTLGKARNCAAVPKKRTSVLGVTLCAVKMGGACAKVEKEERRRREERGERRKVCNQNELSELPMGSGCGNRVARTGLEGGGR